MTTLRFQLPDGSTPSVEVVSLLNAGYAGRDQVEVQAHIDELAELGVPGPETTPALYPVAPYLASQAESVPAQHGRTSGEAEWALVITDDDVLLTVACDHTDRALEVHGVAWSKNTRRARPEGLAPRRRARPTRRDPPPRLGRRGGRRGAHPGLHARRAPHPGPLARGARAAWPPRPRHRADLGHGRDGPGRRPVRAALARAARGSRDRRDHRRRLPRGAAARGDRLIPPRARPATAPRPPRRPIPAGRGRPVR
ncbi:hypothetical protein BEH62_03120 [Clavibacter michiganensis subsp. insidiosus]|nr:hypothetical protein BEH61_12375 [Clavibacter michiganensis subsp. insidiosus]AWG00587.1 hypothetical protein BEH62_03120 [Clavibacter michiganensis subsp. insidiosus]